MAGASVNKVILMGNLGGDPELRYTPSGKAVATFTVATTSSFGGREREPQTEWHKIVVWDKLAEQVKQYLFKGRQVYLEGRLQTRAWDDRSGQKRYTTEIVAHQVLFLGGGAQGRARAEGYGDGPPHPSATPATPSKDGYGYAAEPPPGEVDDIPDSFGGDDDIPF